MFLILRNDFGKSFNNVSENQGVTAYVGENASTSVKTSSKTIPNN